MSTLLRQPVSHGEHCEVILGMANGREGIYSVLARSSTSSLAMQSDVSLYEPTPIFMAFFMMSKTYASKSATKDLFCIYIYNIYA